MPLSTERLSIIHESFGSKSVRMANLAVVASHHVNGVAAIHSELIKETVFKASGGMAYDD